MTNPTIDLTDNGSNGTERRGTTFERALSPEHLILHQIQQTRRQLTEARERLKAARKRVVQLEDAVSNWEQIAGQFWQRRGHSGR